MFLDLGRDVQIARRRALVPALPLPGTRRRDPLRAPGGIRTSTGSVRVTRPSPPQVGQALRSLPVPPQRGQVHIEPHGAGHLADVAGALTLRAGHFARAARSGAVTGAADFVARDIEAGLGAADGLPEIDIHDVLEVAALFGLLLGCAPAAAAEELGEDVAEAAAARSRSGASGSAASRAGAALR